MKRVINDLGISWTLFEEEKYCFSLTVGNNFTIIRKTSCKNYRIRHFVRTRIKITPKSESTTHFPNEWWVCLCIYERAFVHCGATMLKKKYIMRIPVTDLKYAIRSFMQFSFWKEKGKRPLRKKPKLVSYIPTPPPFLCASVFSILYSMWERTLTWVCIFRLKFGASFLVRYHQTNGVAIPPIIF